MITQNKIMKNLWSAYNINTLRTIALKGTNIFLLMLFFALCSLQKANAQSEININGDWLFRYAGNEKAADSIAAAQFYSPAFSTTGWDTVKVPSCWAILGYEEPVYREFKDAPHSEGFYIKRFSVPESFKNKRISLNFGGVWASAEVWLNGHWLGRHDSGYTSFSMLATNAINTEGENVLAVRVRQVYPGYVCDTYDDWSLGGIYRDVTLSTKPQKRWIDKVTAVTDFDERYVDADLNVGVMVYDDHQNGLPANYRYIGQKYQLRYTLTDNAGNTVLDETKDVEGHPRNGRMYNESFHITNPKQWSAETPNLYVLNVQLIENGEVAQTETQKIGFREISTKDGISRINGQAVKLRGVNRHDEWPDVGRATRHEHWLKDLTMMKEMNINYIRACHYQHAKGFIEMCDSIGMYVGEEVCLGGAEKMTEDPQFVPAAMLRTFETVNRDINDPSIIYWSLGNEDMFNQLFYDVAKVTKKLDPTRPVLYPWDADTKMPEEIDIIAPHYWTSYEYDTICQKSTRPVLTTEYVHAYGTQRFGGLEDCWKSLHDNPHGAGGAVWMWADQGVVTPKKWTDKKYKSLSGGNEYLRISGEGWDGITDSYRNPSRDSYELKNVYCPIYPLSSNISTLSSPQIPIHNDYDFISTKDIDIIYKVFVDDKQKSEGKTRLDIAPHSEKDLSIKANIKSLKPGESAYVQLFFMKDGKEIGRKSVVLADETANIPTSVNTKQKTPKFRNSEVPNFRNGFPVGMRPTIWHKMNEGDEIVRGKIDGEKYTMTVKSTDRKDITDGYVVTTDATCEINDSNSFTGTYTFTVNTVARTMKVEYSITPHITSGRYTPVIGMAIKAQPKRWLGLGPDEAYPNKKSAEILGVWDARKFDGTRAAQWVETTDSKRIIFTNDGPISPKSVANHNYYGFGYRGYIDRDSTISDEFRLLSHVLGRSEKGRLNDKNYRLEAKDATYSGSFVINY